MDQKLYFGPHPLPRPITAIHRFPHILDTQSLKLHQKEITTMEQAIRKLSFKLTKNKASAMQRALKKSLNLVFSTML